MPSLKDLRSRISSVTATRKITRAMQMVSAAKLRRAQQAAESARPYAQHMAGILSSLQREVSLEGAGPALMCGNGSDRAYLLVVCTAERGLCGAFNTNIVRLASSHANRLLQEGKDVQILCVGKKGSESMSRRFPGRVVDTVSLVGLQAVDSSLADSISAKITGLFNEGKIDVCLLFFSRFRSVILQTPTMQQLVPFAGNQSGDMKADGKSPVSRGGHDEVSSPDESVYIHETDPLEVLSALLSRNIGLSILTALLENAASEQGARMAAMDSATRNAGGMVDRLTLKYNRQRQAQITKELIEIVSGAEAL